MKTPDRPSISTVVLDLIDAKGGPAVLLEDTRLCGMRGGGTVRQSWRVETARILAAIGETKLRVGHEFAIAAGRLPKRIATEVGLQAVCIEADQLRVKLNLNEREGFIDLSQGFVREMLRMWAPLDVDFDQLDDDDSDLVDEDPSWECPSCSEEWSAREHAKWRDRFSDNCVDAIECPMCTINEPEDDDGPT